MKQKTLRDEIAIAAMAALISNPGQTITVHHPDGLLEMPRSKGIPKMAYVYADEMLKQREQN